MELNRWSLDGSPVTAIPPVALEPGQRFLGERPENSIHFVGVVTQGLERALHVGDDLIGQEAIESIDRSVIFVVTIIGIITPGRIPPAVEPAPEPPVNQNDDRAMMTPSVTVMVVKMTQLGTAAVWRARHSLDEIVRSAVAEPAAV